MTVNVNIIKDTQLTNKALPHFLNMRSTSHGQSKSAFCSKREPMEFVVRKRSVFVALTICHWGKHETVFHT